MDVGAWLRELGLERYAEAFAADDIDAEVLPALSEADLEKLGVSLGHRKKLLKAIEALADAPDTGRPKSAGAERRQLTVLFCDLVGSTELSARLDPEDMGRVLEAYQSACADVIGRWGGHVAKYMGDGVLAYFGWPEAHEDDAERAVRAGLALTQAVADLAAPDGQVLAARVGIATGLVMVGELIGEGSAREQTVVGETPNLAARLQALAAPGAVVIATATQRLVGRLFELEDLGSHSLKGFAEPVAAARVLAEGRAENRFEAVRGARLGPLVGREHELRLLLGRWRRAQDGEGQVVLLSGEAGIGKSRLARALREQLEGEPHTALSHYASPFHTNSALHPVIGLLERAAGLAPDNSPATKITKLEGLLRRGTDDVVEAVPLVAALLGLDGGEAHPALALSPERQKQRTLDMLLGQVVGLSARQPVLVVYEDAHWLDPTTLEAVAMLIGRVARLPVLVLITHRPEFTPPWSGHGHVTQLSLTRLGRQEATEVVARISGGKPLPEPVLDEILAKTDGVPLFVEELTKTVLESGLLRAAGNHFALDGPLPPLPPLPPLAIPATLHDSLMARLDRLGSVREIAQIGAVIGREFPHRLLVALVGRPEPGLSAALDQLVEGGLIFRRGTPPEATYSFKHALVRDAAYESLLRSDRCRLHAAVARQMLGDKGGGRADPPVVALHLERSGQSHAAAEWWHKAASNARAVGADPESIAHLQRALDLLAGGAKSDEVIGLEIQCLVDMMMSMTAALGPQAARPRIAEFLTRANALSKETNKYDQFPLALYVHYINTFNTARISESLQIARTLQSIASSTGNSANAILANRSLGSSLFATGRFEEASTHLRNACSQSINALMSESEYCRHAYLIALQYKCWLEIVQGRIELSKRTAAMSEDLLHETDILSTTWIYRGNLSIYYYLLRSHDEIRRHSAAQRKEFAVMDSPRYAINANLLDTWARIVDGEAVAVPHGYDEWLRDYGIQPGVEIEGPLGLAAVAEMMMVGDHPDQALAALEDASRAIEETGERWFEAEVWRHRALAELALGFDPSGRPSVGLRRALAVAGTQGARLFELRAARDLARLWARQGDRQRAQDLLAPIYGWFTEGFDTPDLIEARALLDELR